MPESNKSFNPGQPDLFLGAGIDWDTVDALSPDLQIQARKHSAAYLMRDNPRLVAAIVELMRLGVSDKEIAKHCGVSTNVPAALRAESFARLSVEDTMRVRLDMAKRLGMAIMVRLQQQIESGEDIPPEKKAA